MSHVELDPVTFVAPGAKLVGTVRLDRNASVWFNAELRGEDAEVVLEEGANVQDNSLVQGVPGHPARLGSYATMGHNARVIGATVDDRALIAMGATVLPGAHVGSHSIIAANATVPEGMQVPPGSLVVGQGRIVRPTTAQEIERIHRTANGYVRFADEYSGRSGLIS